MIIVPIYNANDLRTVPNCLKVENRPQVRKSENRPQNAKR